MTVFPKALIALGRLRRSDTYWRVLIHAMTVLDPIQWRVFVQKDIALELSVSQRTIERVMGQLRDDGVLIMRGGGGLLRYRLNRNLCWASTARKRNARIVEDGEDPVIGLKP